MRHGTLSTIASFWRIFGFLLLPAGIVGGGMLAMSNQVIMGISLGIGGVFGCLTCLTIAGGIDLLIDVEYHLRSINPKFQQRANGNTQRTRQKQEEI